MNRSLLHQASIQILIRPATMDDTDLDEEVKVEHLIAKASSDSEIDGLQQGKCSTVYFEPSLF